MGVGIEILIDDQLCDEDVLFLLICVKRPPTMRTAIAESIVGETAITARSFSKHRYRIHRKSTKCGRQESNQPPSVFAEQTTKTLCSQDFVTVSRDSPTPLADFFSRQNDACIEAFLASGGRGVRGGSSRTSSSSAGGVKSGATLISFSHFVPRQELCPEKRFLSEPMLTKVTEIAL